MNKPLGPSSRSMLLARDRHAEFAKFHGKRIVERHIPESE